MPYGFECSSMSNTTMELSISRISNPNLFALLSKWMKEVLVEDRILDILKDQYQYRFNYLGIEML